MWIHTRTQHKRYTQVTFISNKASSGSLGWHWLMGTSHLDICPPTGLLMKLDTWLNIVKHFDLHKTSQVARYDITIFHWEITRKCKYGNQNVTAKFVKPMDQNKQTNVSIHPVFTHVVTELRSLYITQWQRLHRSADHSYLVELERTLIKNYLVSAQDTMKTIYSAKLSTVRRNFVPKSQKSVFHHRREVGGSG